MTLDTPGKTRSARRLARASSVIAALTLIAFVLPGLPWSSSCRHTLKRIRVSAEMTLARWRGNMPRLLSIEGQVSPPGATVQALDSRSGWAAVADKEGRFDLPDLVWYPGASYELVISNDDDKGVLIQVKAPDAFPENNVFDVGKLTLDGCEEVALSSLVGSNATTWERFDAKNLEYYQELFSKLTDGKESDQQKLDSITEFVASKFNDAQTRSDLVSPRRILEEGSRYCGHLSVAMETLVAAGGYKTRTVDLTDGRNPPGTHAVVEVFYAGEWHLYDPTYDVRFRDENKKVLSYREVRLNTSVISEELFNRFDPNVRRGLSTWLASVYNTGYHHLYAFKQ